MLDIIKRIFLIKWLWNIFAGFYLIAYAFWIPTLFNDLIVIIFLFIITLILGGGLLTDGFFRANELNQGSIMPNLPFKRTWRVLGAMLLLSYLLVYIPPEGRIVAHWPLDLVITLLTGVVIFLYGVLGY